MIFEKVGENERIKKTMRQTYVTLMGSLNGTQFEEINGLVNTIYVPAGQRFVFSVLATSLKEEHIYVKIATGKEVLQEETIPLNLIASKSFEVNPEEGHYIGVFVQWNNGSRTFLVKRQKTPPNFIEEIFNMLTGKDSQES